jgi:hypothetical protein
MVCGSSINGLADDRVADGVLDYYKNNYKLLIFYM